MNLEKIFKNTILLYFLSTVVFLIIAFTIEKNFLGEELYLIDSEIDLFIIPALEEAIFILIWSISDILRPVTLKQCLIDFIGNPAQCFILLNLSSSTAAINLPSITMQAAESA
mgnify:CR=1 FL=1